MIVNINHRDGMVTVAFDPKDAHSFGCFIAGLIPHGDGAIEDAHDIIRSAHELMRSCDAADSCPFPKFDGDDDGDEYRSRVDDIMNRMILDVVTGRVR